MHRLDKSDIRGSSQSGALIAPTAINAVCPSCSTKVTFSFIKVSEGPQYSIAGNGRCPNCSTVASFWCLNPSDDPTKIQLYMHPTPPHFISLPEGVDDLEPSLRRSLEGAIQSYNAGIYTSTAVMGRRTLEGLFKSLLPKDKQNLNLFNMIKEVRDHKDLSEPLETLSNAIRAGGNLGAHFDAEREPDQAMAKNIIDLLIYLISYLYILPRQIEALERLVEAEPAAATAVSPD